MTTIIEWIAASLQILGSIVLASRILSPRAAYWMMLPGALIYLTVAFITRDWPLLTMQVVFAIINAIGIVRWKP